MFRWEDVDTTDYDGIKLKMYRDIYEHETAQLIPYENKEIDHYAFDYLGSELFMYKVLDTNFTSLMEERFDYKRVKKLYIPTKEKS